MNARDEQESTTLETYLSRLDAELRALPENERREILLETRSHVMEHTRRAPARSVDDVLVELGSPDTYARQFLTEEPPAAPPRASTLSAIARLAAGRWTGLPLLFVVVAAYAVSVLAVVMAISKVIEPNATGLWIDSPNGHIRSAEFVMSNPGPHPGRDVLGYWFVPVALSIALIIHLTMSALLRRIVRAQISK